MKSFAAIALFGLAAAQEGSLFADMEANGDASFGNGDGVLDFTEVAGGLALLTGASQDEIIANYGEDFNWKDAVFLTDNVSSHFDEEGNGLEAHEVSALAETLGFDLSEEDAAYGVEWYDNDGNGSLDLWEQDQVWSDIMAGAGLFHEGDHEDYDMEWDYDMDYDYGMDWDYDMDYDYGMDWDYDMDYDYGMDWDYDMDYDYGMDWDYDMDWDYGHEDPLETIYESAWDIVDGVEDLWYGEDHWYGEEDWDLDWDQDWDQDWEQDWDLDWDQDWDQDWEQDWDQDWDLDWDQDWEQDWDTTWDQDWDTTWDQDWDTTEWDWDY